MTKIECTILVKAIKVLYPRWKPDDFAFAVNAYFFILRDIDVHYAAASLLDYAQKDTSGIQPGIHDIYWRLRDTDGREQEYDEYAYRLMRDLVGI